MRPVFGVRYRNLPPLADSLNRSHPLSRDLLYFYVWGFRRVPVDLVSGRLAICNGTEAVPLTLAAAQATGLYGPAPMVYAASSTGNITYNVGAETINRQPSLPLTMAYRGNGYNSGTRRGLMCTCIGLGNYCGAWMAQVGDLNRSLEVGYGDNGGTATTNKRIYTTGTTWNRTYHTCGVSIRGATDMTVYLDGFFKDTTGAYSGTGGAMAYVANSSGRLWHGPVSTNGLSSQMAWAALWARNLTDEEHLELALNPFGMFSQQ